MTVVLTVVTSILLLLGFAGVFLPVLPGVPLAWLGLLIYAIGTGFEKISVTATVIFSVLMLLTLAFDLAAPMLGAKKYQASKWGVMGASLGLLVGILTMGFVGTIVGPLLGALVMEFIAKGQPVPAMKAALGTFVGFIAGTLFRTIVVLSMIGFFIYSVV